MTTTEATGSPSEEGGPQGGAQAAAPRLVRHPDGVRAAGQRTGVQRSAIRGVIMQFGMLVGGWITYQLTTPDISPIGRLAGGLAVYVFSIVDANGIANRRVKAWARIEAEMREKASQKAARGSGGKKRQGVPARKSGGSGARRTEVGTAPDAAGGAPTPGRMRRPHTSRRRPPGSATPPTPRRGRPRRSPRPADRPRRGSTSRLGGVHDRRPDPGTLHSSAPTGAGANLDAEDDDGHHHLHEARLPVLRRGAALPRRARRPLRGEGHHDGPGSRAGSGERSPEAPSPSRSPWRTATSGWASPTPEAERGVARAGSGSTTPSAGARDAPPPPGRDAGPQTGRRRVSRGAFLAP